VDRGARAARLDEDVRGGGGLGGTQGEGGGDAVGVAVGFDEVATFDVRLEVEVGDEGLEGFGFGGLLGGGFEGGLERWEGLVDGG